MFLIILFCRKVKQERMFRSSWYQLDMPFVIEWVWVWHRWLVPWNKSLWKYLWYSFMQLLILFQCQNRVGRFQEGPGLGVNHTTDCGIPEEEPFPVVYNFKVMRRFAHPFSLSFSLSSLSSDTLSFPLTSSNIHGVLMPPAAACKLSCRLQQSQVSLVAGLSNSWFSLPLCHLC